MTDPTGHFASGVQLRPYRSGDPGQMADLFYETVHTVNAKDYSRAQLDAWATGEIDRAAWGRSFRAHRTLVAVMGAQIVGFGDMDDSGYLDRLYVHKDFQGRGIGSAICDAPEAGGRHFTTHASVTARPFFEKRGYAALRSQQVVRQGVALTNFVMEKRVGPYSEEPARYF